MASCERGCRQLNRKAPRSPDGVQVSDKAALTHNSSRLWA